MKVAIINNSLCLTYDNGEIFAKDIAAKITYPGNAYNLLTMGVMGKWILTGNIAQTDNVTMKFTPQGQGMLIQTTFTNLSGHRIENTEHFSPFICTLSHEPDKLLCNRFCRANGNLVNEMQSAIDSIRTTDGTEYHSADFCAYESKDEDGNQISGIFGFASYEKYFSAVKMTREGRIEAYQFLESHPLDIGQEIVSDLVYLSPCSDIPSSGIPEFIELCAHLAQAPVVKERAVCGFCTWYYYGPGVDQEIIRENMEVLDRHKTDIPVEYVQIDDGWYDNWGDWNPNKKFSYDMKAMADEIKTHGYLPGIWLAPFGASEKSKLFQNHPEYFVKTKDGAIWKNLSLDFSNPEVCQYMYDLFHRISYDWGFRYIKMDIITGTLAPGVHQNPGFTALQNYRAGLRLIRSAVTEDTFLLACTAPLAPAAGLVDGMRVSCDIFERWESLINVFNAVLKRYYYHNVFFINDADCLIIREAEEEDDQCFRLCTRTEKELKTYITAAAASGGILMLSDKMPLLKEKKWKWISYLFPQNTKAAVPLDLMDSYVPSVLDFGKFGATQTVALINWGETPHRMRVPYAAGKLVFEFWSQKFIGFCKDNLWEELEPHESRVYFLTDPAPKAVVGTDASIVFSVQSQFEGEKLQYSKNKPDEKLCIAEINDGGICFSHWE